jgi:hypothetical protein
MNVSEALAPPFMLILVLTIGLPSSAQSVTTSQYDNARRGPFGGQRPGAI